MRAIQVELSPGSATKRRSPARPPTPSSPATRAPRDAVDTGEYEARTLRDQYYYNNGYAGLPSRAAPDAGASRMMAVELDAILRGERSRSGESGPSRESSCRSGTTPRFTNSRRSASSSPPSPHDAAPRGFTTRHCSVPRHHEASPTSTAVSHSPVSQLRPPPPLSYVSVRGPTGRSGAAHIGDDDAGRPQSSSARPLRERRSAMRDSIERFLSSGEAAAPCSTARNRASVQRTPCPLRQHSVAAASPTSSSPSPPPRAPGSSKQRVGTTVTRTCAPAPLPRRALFAPMPVNQSPAPTAKGQRRSAGGGGHGENAAAPCTKGTRGVRHGPASSIGKTAPSVVSTQQQQQQSSTPVAARAFSPTTPPQMAATFSLLPYAAAASSPSPPPPSAADPATGVPVAAVLDGRVVTVHCAACASTLCLLAFHRFGTAAPPVCHCPACGNPV